jgi:hypothetical protein
MKYAIVSITASIATAIVVATSLGSTSSQSSDPVEYGSPDVVQLGYGPSGVPSAAKLDYGSPALLQEGYGPSGAPRG